MKIVVDKEKCTGCGLCTRVCPQKVLEVKDRLCHTRHEPHCDTCGIVQDKDIGRCMGCFGCEDECPEGAIRLIKALATHGDNIPIIPPPKGITECDVAVVGGGPSGMGAAITCARAGLDVVVFEKLPNRELSHHNDGGVMFTIPGCTSVKIKGDKIVLPEIDITLDAKIADRLDYIGMLGPDGIETQSDFPEDLDGFVQSKAKLLQQLSDLAETVGVKMWYNTKVVDILKEGRRVCGVKLHTGEEIKAKVVVTADGIFAHMTEKAGFQVDRQEPWYTVAMRYDFEKTTPEMKALPRGYHYVIGGMEPEDEMFPGYDSCQGSIAVTGTVHLAVGFVMKGPEYPAPKPIDFYVDKFLNNDPRVKQLFGNLLDGKKHGQLLGFRARFRKEHLKDRVGHGVICVGDAWVDDCDLGNLPSLTNGVHAGRVIVNAAKKGDFSKAALEPANEFVTDRVLKYLTDSKKTKLSSTVLNQEEIDEWFKYLPHFNYPMLVFGGPKHQTVALARYMWGNAFRFYNLRKYPKLKDYVFG